MVVRLICGFCIPEYVILVPNDPAGDGCGVRMSTSGCRAMVPQSTQARTEVCNTSSDRPFQLTLAIKQIFL